MREIKFRAWYSAEPNAHHYSKGKLLNPDQMFYDEWPGQCLGFAHQGQPVTIEQFTGLKDKNGKDIYEGDLRQGKWRCCEGCSNPNKEHSAVQVMRWNQHLACFEWDGPDIPDFIGIEVIGNIHENPELLRAQGGSSK